MSNSFCLGALLYPDCTVRTCTTHFSGNEIITSWPIILLKHRNMQDQLKLIVLLPRCANNAVKILIETRTTEVIILILKYG